MIAALFAVVWAVAIAYWKFARLDQRLAPAAAGDQESGAKRGRRR